MADLTRAALVAEELRSRARSAPLPRTARLGFREMQAGDVDDMAALLGDPEVMRYYPRPKNRDEALGWIAWNRRHYETFGFGLWVITLVESGEFVGDCGLTPQTVEGEQEIEVGYHVKRNLWCRGLATEGAAACRDYALDVLELRRLVAIIDPGNAASERVAQKIGMRREREVAYAGRVARLFVLESPPVRIRSGP